MRNADLTGFAKANRRQMTEPETRLWLELRAERFADVKFRRQKVIGPYIADFASNVPKLVIEVDGDTHEHDNARDQVRTRFLEQQGYKVLRFKNSEVMANMTGVLSVLLAAIAALRLAPLPPLSPEGERAR